MVNYRGIIYDGVRALGYDASEEVVALADGVGFTWLGKLHFYAAQPVFDDTDRASAECGIEKGSAVLGCYAEGIIYVYDVDNSELKGVEEVTAAHEMLHAAYTGLKAPDKERVNQLLKNEENSRSNDKSFMERLSVYDGLNEADRLNELHSIIGTEVSDISAELEQYYAQYFESRAKVVALHDDYAAVFGRLQDELDQLVERYNSLIDMRNQLVTSMNERQGALERRIASANAAGGVSRSEAAAVNAEVDQFNAELSNVRYRVARYDSELENLRQKIDSSNARREKLDQIIDSSLAPAAQL